MLSPSRERTTNALALNDESLKAYLAPTGLVSEPRGDLTCRGDLRLEVLISVPSVGFIYFHSIVVASSYRIFVTFSTLL